MGGGVSTEQRQILLKVVSKGDEFRTRAQLARMKGSAAGNSGLSSYKAYVREFTYLTRIFLHPIELTVEYVFQAQ